MMATVVAILKFYSGVNLYCSFVLPIHKFSPESFTWFLCRWQKRSVVCESVMGTGVQHNLQSMWFFVFVFVFFLGSCHTFVIKSHPRYRGHPYPLFPLDQSCLVLPHLISPCWDSPFCLRPSGAM